VTALAEKIVIPETQADLEDLLSDQGKVNKLFETDQYYEVIGAYAKSWMGSQVSTMAAVREEAQRVLNQIVADDPDSFKVKRLDMTPRDSLAPPRSGYGKTRAKAAGYNPKAMGAMLDQDFVGQDGASQYFKTIWHNTNKTVAVQNALTRIRNAFSSTVPSEGGFLIPEVLRAELLRVSLESGVVRSRARVIPMETLTVPFPAIDATSNVSSVFGGIVGYWTEEGAALTASSATFARIVLAAKKLTLYTTVPNELLSDSLVSFQSFIDEIFPEALSYYEDLAFLKGNGVGQPLGALASGNPALIAVAKESGQAAASIVWENIVHMYARMLPQSLNSAVWIVSPDTFAELATMALSVGTGGSAIWLANGQDGPPMTILGRPVITSEKAPGILGAQGDISFVDFGFYLVGDRQVMSAMASPHFLFNQDHTAYRIIQRVDGRPWINSAITPQNNGPTLSPFVQLAVRA
jgi:HK97 family phage major capsid protein